MMAAKKLSTRLGEKLRIMTIDSVKVAFPLVHKVVYFLYNRMLYKRKRTFKAYLKVYDRENEVLPFFMKTMCKRYLRYMRKRQRPDVIFAVYGLAANIISTYKRDHDPDLLTVTMITDFCVYDSWINEGTDLYLVGAPYTRDLLIERGIDPEKIIFYGFALPSETEKNLVGRELPIRSNGNSKETIRSGSDTDDTDRINLLIAGGVLGLLPEETDFYAKLSAHPGVHIHVVCGKNEILRKNIESAGLPNVRAYGFIDNMFDHLAWADIFMGKAGGLSCMEAIHMEVPILYLPPFLPHEAKNADFFEISGIGRLYDHGTTDTADAFDRDFLAAAAENMRTINASFEPERLLTWLRERNLIQ